MGIQVTSVAVMRAGGVWGNLDHTQSSVHSFVGGSVPSRHLSPDEDTSGPFNFLLTDACVLSALGSTRLWLSPQQEVLSLFLHCYMSHPGDTRVGTD